MRTEIYTRSLDELKTDLLVLTVFEDERPPRKITGLVDWRLNGFLSKKIIDHSISGSFGEKVLVPLHDRLQARRLLLFGLGSAKEFTQSKAEVVGKRLGEIISEIGTVDVAIHVPSSQGERIVGSTQRAIMDAISGAKLPDSLLLRWMDVSIVATDLFLPKFSEQNEVVRRAHQ